MFKQNIMLFILSKQTTNSIVHLETDMVNNNLPRMWRSIINKYKMKTHTFIAGSLTRRHATKLADSSSTKENLTDHHLQVLI